MTNRKRMKLGNARFGSYARPAFMMLAAVAGSAAATTGCGEGFSTCEDTRSCEEDEDGENGGSSGSGGSATTSGGTASGGTSGSGSSGEAGESGSEPEAMGGTNGEEPGELPDGEPAPGKPCTSGSASVCLDAAEPGYLACSDGTWAEKACERGSLCDSSEGSCAPIIEGCESLDPGDAFCDGTVSKECGPDLVTVTEVQCEGQCVNGECVAATCGDGVVQEGEECDDGNAVDTDACVATCKEPICGDGILHKGEFCDDGNAVEADDCTTACQAPRCGDGFTWQGKEACDDANAIETDDCLATCVAASCGDGLIQSGVETCDDANKVNTDACVACKPAKCGDGHVQTGKETCDDKNTKSGDGCSSTCSAWEAVGVTTGNTHSCAWFKDGRAKCWGSGASGQLGVNSTASRGDGAGEMGANLPWVGLQNITSVEAGQNVTCALSAGGVWCWGSNISGRLGLGSSVASSAVPQRVVLNGTARAIALGTSGHACAIVDLPGAPGQVRCWGNNYEGQLGAGLDVDNMGTAPDEVGDGMVGPVLDAPATAIVAAIDFSCVLTNRNEVRCWGVGNIGQLGHLDVVTWGRRPSEEAPLKVDLGTGFVPKQITAGGSHACALSTEGTVKCWGANGQGQLGYGDTDNRPSDARAMGDDLPEVDLGGTATAIAAGAYHTCAVLSTGALKCWGSTANGAMGRPSGANINVGDIATEMGSNLPSMNLGTGAVVRAVSTRTEHICAQLSTSGIKCWGVNDSGQLGLGNTTTKGDATAEMGDALPELVLQ